MSGQQGVDGRSHCGVQQDWAKKDPNHRFPVWSHRKLLLMTDKGKSLPRHLHKQDNYHAQTRVHHSTCTCILADITDAHILVSYLMRGHQRGWVCVAARTHKLLKNVVYSFHWCEFKLSSVWAPALKWGSCKTQWSRSFIGTLDFNDTSKQYDVWWTRFLWDLLK